MTAKQGASNRVQRYTQVIAETSLREIADRIGLTLEYKLTKLKQAMDFAITQNKNGEIINIQSKLLLGAIAEANKMQGHYAPEQREQKVELTQVEEYINQYKRDY